MIDCSYYIIATMLTYTIFFFQVIKEVIRKCIEVVKKKKKKNEHGYLFICFGYLYTTPMIYFVFPTTSV
ncbi:uncharacterized protein BX663DRAFT_504240, partial [Cokeromyces recurvatus]|uniref:uncharacterized protein n=1 Tax=Cokeromyces recurvatus TaxID=90255 RepID=UPI00222079D5